MDLAKTRRVGRTDRDIVDTDLEGLPVNIKQMGRGTLAGSLVNQWVHTDFFFAAVVENLDFFWARNIIIKVIKSYYVHVVLGSKVEKSFLIK